MIDDLNPLQASTQMPLVLGVLKRVKGEWLTQETYMTGEA